MVSCTQKYSISLYVPVCKGIYLSVPVHTSMYHYILDYDFAIQRIYEYVRVQTVPNRLKKSANMSRTSNLLHAVCRIYPFTMGFRPECRIKSNEGIHEYIDCYCKSPGLCTWCPGLMTHCWRRSSSAATPGHDIARTSLDLDSPKSQTCILACLRCCNVPADGSPILPEIEAAT